MRLTLLTALMMPAITVAGIAVATDLPPATAEAQEIQEVEGVEDVASESSVLPENPPEEEIQPPFIDVVPTPVPVTEDIPLNPASDQEGVEAEADSPNMLEKARDALTEAVESVRDGAAQLAFPVQGAVRSRAHLGSQQDASDILVIDETINARMLIGRTLRANNDRRIGRIEDVILTEDGDKPLLLIRHGGFWGMGAKMATLDYARAVHAGSDGDVVVPLSQSAAAALPEFTSLPEGRYRASTALGAELRGADGAAVGIVENIVFGQGVASRLIVNYNGPLGLAEQIAAIPYKAVEKDVAAVPPAFTLSESQAQAFAAHRDAVNLGR